MQAEEILRKEKYKNRSKGSFLMRFSRTQPEFIAFTSINNGKIKHVTNMLPNGEALSIEKVIQYEFPSNKYSMVSERLDFEELEKVSTMSGYAVKVQGYLTVSLELEETPDSSESIPTRKTKPLSYQTKMGSFYQQSGMMRSVP